MGDSLCCVDHLVYAATFGVDTTSIFLPVKLELCRLEAAVTCQGAPNSCVSLAAIPAWWCPAHV